MSKSKEVFWWSLFSAGGVLSALFVPALIVTTGLVLPFLDDAGSAQRHDHLYGLIASWPARLVLFGVIFLTFFHCAHRFRHILVDLGLRPYSKALGVLFYGAALVGSVLAAQVLLTI